MDITAHISDRLLLDHPFYRRWEDGKLESSELASYAAQYRFFEAQLPSFLEALAGQLDGDLGLNRNDASVAGHGAVAGINRSLARQQVKHGLDEQDVNAAFE